MARAKVLLGVFLVAFFATAWADQVVPSERVQTRLRVRHDPDVTSTIVGHLNKGATNKSEGTIWARLFLCFVRPNLYGDGPSD